MGSGAVDFRLLGLSIPEWTILIEWLMLVTVIGIIVYTLVYLRVNNRGNQAEDREMVEEIV